MIGQPPAAVNAPSEWPARGPAHRPRLARIPPAMLEPAALALACLAVLMACSPQRDEAGATSDRGGGPGAGTGASGAFAERQAERDAMVAEQIAPRGVRDPAVLAALRRVPRHAFVPPDQVASAYEDHPLPIGEGQTISQPYIVALMTEALRLRHDSRVLEIGTGSGYQAAVLAEITPHVATIEIVPELAARAGAAFAALGYATIAAREGDGYLGWPERAPFDAIMVTAAPDHVPPALVAQLAPGGRLCLPVGAEGGDQELLVITKAADGTVSQETIAPVRFVPMTGEAQERDAR
jgi:protein-L-isoaspartate(D-aspartate) O-methyltransferase